MTDPTRKYETTFRPFLLLRDLLGSGVSSRYLVRHATPIPMRFGCEQLMLGSSRNARPNAVQVWAAVGWEDRCVTTKVMAAQTTS